MSTHFEMNRRGVRQLLKGDEMGAMLLDRAETEADFARRIAPRRSGEYAESIEAFDGGIGGRRRDRRRAVIVASAPHAAAVEWGNAHQPQAYHILGRVADIIEAN